MSQLGLHVRSADLSEWDRVLEAIRHPGQEVTIAMIGKYVALTEAYKSLNEALFHAGIHTKSKVNIRFIDSEDLEPRNVVLEKMIGQVDGILVPGGFGERGIEGKIRAIQYARERKIPFLGICLGMQLAVIEYARDVLGLETATSTEFDAKTETPIIGLITEWLTQKGEKEARSKASELGGTMRLGAQITHLEKDTLAQRIYHSDTIYERHRHRYEVNNHYLEPLEKAEVTNWKQ